MCDGCYSKLSSKTNTPPTVNSPPLSRSNTDLMNSSSNNRNADDIAKREQEEIEKAIALSLRDSQTPKKLVSFNVPAKSNSSASLSPSKPAPVTSIPDEDDEDLKAAIAASLNESQKQTSYDPRAYSLSYDKRIQPEDSLARQASALSISSVPRNSSSPSNAAVPSAPNPHDLSGTELENVRLFSELVERTDMEVKARGPQALNPAQIQVGDLVYLQKSLDVAAMSHSYSF